MPLLLDISDDAFAAVLGARRGVGMGAANLTAERYRERYQYYADMLWRAAAPERRWEGYRKAERLVRDAGRSPQGMARALAALNLGADVIERDSWEPYPLAAWALRELANAIAISFIKRRRAELDQLLADLKLDQCSTRVACSRTTTSIATAMRKRFHDGAVARVEQGTLDADWMAARCETEFQAATILTIGRMAARRSGSKARCSGLRAEFPSLAELHGIPTPPPARCRAAVSAWLDAPAPERRACALAALARR